MRSKYECRAGCLAYRGELRNHGIDENARYLGDMRKLSNYNSSRSRLSSFRDGDAE